MKTGLAQKVLAEIQQKYLLSAGDRVGVAVSGGADSIALLLLLLELREKLGLVLSVVHFNHQLRGNASDTDEQFVQRLAAKHGLVFHVGRGNVRGKAKREKANLEDAARRSRYEFFSRLAAEGIVSHIAVAHTADDQAETVLAHILRGTGLAGLGGIHPVAGPVIRPLLTIRRAELRAYLRSKKQKWSEDATNRDTTRMRARIRKRLLPILERDFQPVVVAHLTTLADLARQDEKFLDAAARSAFDTLVRREAGGLRIGAEDLLAPLKNTFAGAPEGSDTAAAISSRLARTLLENAKCREGQISAAHVHAVLGLARTGENGKLLQLPAGVEVRRERNTLLFSGSADPRGRAPDSHLLPYEFPFDLACGESLVRIPGGCAIRLRVIDWPTQRRETSKDTAAAIDCEKIAGHLVLRSSRPGDRFRPAGRQSAHKLKRLLNEKRISRWERAGWPVLSDGGTLIWVRGFPVAATHAPQTGTRSVLVIEEESAE